MNLTLNSLNQLKQSELLHEDLRDSVNKSILTQKFTQLLTVDMLNQYRKIEMFAPAMTACRIVVILKEVNDMLESAF